MKEIGKNRTISIVCMLAMVLCMTACGSSDNGNSAETERGSAQASVQTDSPEPTSSDTGSEPASGNNKDNKILVAYFSATGTTKALAEHAADVLGADLYEIVPKEPYTDADLDYGDDNSRSTKEMNDSSARPEIEGNVESMEQYTTVLLGYPIWWGRAPMILDTFIESYDFSGKTIVPFCTSGGSGIGSSAEELEELCKGDAKWLDGERLDSDSDREDIAEWIDGLGLETDK